MSWKIALSDLTFGPEEAEAVQQVLASGWLTMGERTAAFESTFAEALGAPRALAVTNGTAALHLAYTSLGVGPGDEVICPSLTFVATANAALQCGATVVLADIRGEDDLGVDPADVEAKITSRTRAIAAVHYAGHPCDMDALGELAVKHRLALVEDAAHAPGGRWRGRALGTLGDVGCFSFFSNKNLAVGEGGAMLARDEAVHERARLLRSHGMTTLTLERHRGHASSYDVIAAGMNYRMDELRAALGLVQLGRLARNNTRRRELCERYHARLSRISGLSLPYREYFSLDKDGTESAYHLMVVLLPDGTQRDAVRTALKAEGIQTSVHYPPIHRFSYHSASERVRTQGLAHTDAVAHRLLTLPLHPRMRDGDVDTVCNALQASLR